MRVPTKVATALIALGATLACSKGRQLDEGTPANRVSWEEDIAPVFASRCSSCHSGPDAAAGYDTTSYLSALGPTDAQIAVANDPDSRLLQTIDPARADAVHAKVSDVYKVAREWVVDGRVSFNRVSPHEGGVLNPKDQWGEFHGSVLKNTSWNFALCQDCHGVDFSGGKAEVSCLACHPKGPTACDTCHGQPPKTSSHLAHTAGELGKKLDCSECHVKPVKYDDPGHLLTSDGKPKSKATVTFAAEGQAAHPGPGRTGPPAWDGKSCSNVYCHGAAFQDAGATHISPTWDKGSGEALCGACHGLPPVNHAALSPSGSMPELIRKCSVCHKATAHSDGSLTAAVHVDGTAQIGDGTGSCSGCHGSAKNAAPPSDLSGNTTPDALGVGAHQAHLTNSQRLTAPIACNSCHLVPAAIQSPGHLDTSLPAEVTFSGLAVTDGAAATWDRTTATCTSYCHGGGQSLAADTNFKLRKPVWTLGVSQAFCGSCHGAPPSTPAHRNIDPFDFRKCSDCHPNTVAKNGSIIVSGPPGAQTSRHINGRIDVGP
jgi:predicted CxxxxCH...CXXCH cytochrome family protein